MKSGVRILFVVLLAIATSACSGHRVVRHYHVIVVEEPQGPGYPHPAPDPNPPDPPPPIYTNPVQKPDPPKKYRSGNERTNDQTRPRQSEDRTRSGDGSRTLKSGRTR